ncbi:PP2C family protein-serine/threonine phosphatase [Methanosphaerula palustris]|uniref:Protein serine/threonine phosphatase n=1 Tax=Methanosphaerula palustris (strain ATCC BAA-1556 / DSM 19958 / E1-9c) TaxID=521011 RepID=B8GKT9_METPE|nr:SpoIIE family protein phosphatase [Methanosphaerula palustris]ACL17235.1 protein serine/threonine phosphatase [Methanosphaerula palustris E1-9c]
MTEIDLIVNLVEGMSVLIVVTYLLTRSQLYAAIVDRQFTLKNRLLIMLICGVFSIYGTLAGVPYEGAILSVRDIGPAFAGLLAGPWVGLGAGIIGGLFRYGEGGFMALGGTLGPMAAGLIWGMVWFRRQGRPVSLIEAMLLAVLVEVVRTCFDLLFADPLDQTVHVLAVSVIPIMLVNAIGMAIFVLMLGNVTHERSVLASQGRLEGELSVARRIQRAGLPAGPLSWTAMQVAGRLEPALEVGGDFYDYFLVGDDQVFVTVGDVSGKGVPAALFMAMTASLIRSEAVPEATPSQVLAEVNRHLCRNNEAMMFVTIFCGVVTISTGRITYASAGHLPPYLLDRAGTVTPLTCVKAPPIGIRETTAYLDQEAMLPEGSALLLYTDGVTEAEGIDGEFFSMQHLCKVLSEQKGRTAEDVVSAIFDAVLTYEGALPQSDDITLCAISRPEAGYVR